MNKKTVLIISISLIVSFTLCFNVFASSDLDDVDANTIISGWSFSGAPHMGTKNLTYTYLSNAVKNAYDGYITDGKSLWGNNINMNYSSSYSDSVLTIVASSMESSASMGLSIGDWESNTDHITLCAVLINTQVFDSYSYAGKIRAVAHELGHVYGLGEISSSSSIMYPYYSTTNNVTNNDIWGMKVVTHVHEHGPIVMGTTYEVLDASYHNVTCNSCKGKIRRVHAPNANGVCACGYTGPFLYP